MKSSTRASGKKKPATFDTEAFLNSAGLARTITEYGKNETYFPRAILARPSCTSRKGK